MYFNIRIKSLEFDSDIEIIPTYDWIEYLDSKFGAFSLLNNYYFQNTDILYFENY